jgi:hypothetical protein
LGTQTKVKFFILPRFPRRELPPILNKSTLVEDLTDGLEADKEEDAIIPDSIVDFIFQFTV